MVEISLKGKNGYSIVDVSEVALWWPLAYPDKSYQKKASEKWSQKAKIAIQNKTDIELMEVVVTCKDGSQKNILWGFVSTGDENWAFGLNLTEFRKTEQELISSKEQAEESERLKTAFLHNISHEIRTPLNSISGFASLLSVPDITEEKRSTFCKIIQNSSDQLVSIVSDILTISSLEAKQVTVNTSPVIINVIILELLTIFKQQSLNHNISIY